MKARPHLQFAPTASVELLSQFPELSPIILHILAQRNIITEEAINRWLHPDYIRDLHDPFLFKDMTKAVQRIIQARDNNASVLIYGDYDADGVCSSVLLYDALQQIGIKNLKMYLPHRDLEGYGLNIPAIQQFVQDKVSLMITVDCAISNAEEVAFAQQQGIDVIVTDHHVEPPQLPTTAYAIINPQVKSCGYPFPTLAGVGVAFKLAQALGKTLNLGEAFEKWLLDLVAISTITDCMPLHDENRVLVHYGLVVLNKTRRLGLRQLIQATRCTTVTTTDIGYRLGPWINAAGRIDHANMAVSLLMAKTTQEADGFARKLGETNSQRQSQTETMMRQAKQQLGDGVVDPVVYVKQMDWALGLVGLVAGKLVSEFHKPAFVLTKHGGSWAGSGRSVPGLNMVMILQQLDTLFSHYGGHAMACGFTLKDTVTIEQFQRQFNQLAEPILAKLDSMPTLAIAAKIQLSDITWDLMEQLNWLQPFGEGNPEPKFLLSGVHIKDWQLVGQQQQHVRLILADDAGKTMKAMAFGQSVITEQVTLGQQAEFVCKLGVNRWNGNSEIQITVIHLMI